jgi:cytochrome c-type biogenesis protein CcmE
VLNRRRFIVGAALIAAAVSYLVYAGIRTTSMYYLELGEFVARRDGLSGEMLRVKGWVRHGSIDRTVSTNELRFELAGQDDTNGVPVSYRGIMPDMFAEGREVVVEGRFDGHGLTARQIMTSCPSKYEPAGENAAARAGS